MRQVIERGPRIGDGQNLSLELGTGVPLDVRRFRVDERMDALFEVTLEVLTSDATLPLDDLAGDDATFHLRDAGRDGRVARSWSGVVRHAELIAAEPDGLSTYEVVIAPRMWLLTQRRNHRIFQGMSSLEIARAVLSEWGVEHDVQTGAHPRRDWRVQYGETDFAFVCRMLEEAGIAFFFRVDEDGSLLVLTDRPESAPARPMPVPFRDRPLPGDRDHVTRLRFRREVRPGRFSFGDLDHRLPSRLALGGSAAAGARVEARLEVFDYQPGALLAEGPRDEGTPTADDRFTARSDAGAAARVSSARVAAVRGGAHTATFETSAGDLGPGVVVAITDHPHPAVDDRAPLLVVAAQREGTSFGAWSHRCEARPAGAPYAPALDTPKPRVMGVESATVVGAAGDEIHTDELGRVRVQFHWDREGQHDERSSIWIPVSHSWGGAGYGSSNLPRVGQEVIVDFLGGDPDRPVVVGRVYTTHQPTPYKLPDNKTQSGWKSCSTGGTGGFNEIMFEDAAGRELVRMQAEKDLKKLVKNDEDVTIGRDRSKLVKRDDALVVERDRSKRVEHDEDVVIGNDRAERVERDEDLVIGNDRRERVEHDEDVVIGNDRSKRVERDDDLSVGGDRAKLVQTNERDVVLMSRTRMVGLDEAVVVGVAQQLKVGTTQLIDVGKDQTVKVGKAHNLSVGKNQTVDIGSAQSVAVGKNQSLKVGGAQSVNVGKGAKETVGLAKMLSVGAAYQISVGGIMNTSVAGMASEQVGMMKTVTAGTSIAFSCGASSLVLEASGKIILAVAGGGSIVLEGKDAMVASGEGGSVFVIGGPDVHVNP
jgi:type VI secretion system secreted protein VgrG